MQVSMKQSKTSDSLNVLKLYLNSHNLIGTLGILFHCVYINYRVPYKTGFKKKKKTEEEEWIKGNKDNGNKNSIEWRQTGLELR